MTEKDFQKKLQRGEITADHLFTRDPWMDERVQSTFRIMARALEGLSNRCAALEARLYVKPHQQEAAGSSS